MESNKPKKKIAYNSELKINSLLILKCEDKSKLLDWQRKLDAHISEIDNQLSSIRLKFKNGTPTGSKAFMKTKMYRTIQVTLRKNIKSRLSELNFLKKSQIERQVSHINKKERELIFWKNKVKELSPEKYFIFCKEIEELFKK